MPVIFSLPEVCLYRIFGFFVAEKKIDAENFSSVQSICKYTHSLINSKEIWQKIPLVRADRHLNLDSFKLLKKKSQGTEGSCYHAYSRSKRREYAVKRARVYPDNEGVPYYMMRELSALKKLSHPNICELEMINLHNFKLYLLFPYIEQTLYDFLNPIGDSSTGQALLKPHVYHLTKQMLEGVAHIHRRGIMHRNLKPKHILIQPGPNPVNPLEGAKVKIADFALVRIVGQNSNKKFTTEVITLWYRPPEILMGQKEYDSSVDIWSLGCIYAEMIQGRPLFTGLCEIDQLFQIFFKMGTPTRDNWPAFPSMPHYQDTLFPQWQLNQLRTHVKNAGELEYDLLCRMLRFEPRHRISAHEALRHPCIDPSAAISKGFSMTPFGCQPHISPSKAQQQSLTSNLGKFFSKNMAVDMSSLDDLLDQEELEMKYSHPDLVNVQRTTLRHYCFLRQLEVNCDSDIRAKFISTSQADSVLNTERMDLVDWLVEVLEVFDYHMCLRTLYFAVTVVDHVLAATPVSVLCRLEEDLTRTEEDVLRLLGATCLHIASKCEDVSYIGIKDLASQTSTVQLLMPSDILTMEEIVLNTLSFNIYIPTVIDFLGFYMDCVPEMNDFVLKSCARYLGEISLVYIDSIRFLPSRIASACIFFTLLLNDLPPWPITMRTISGYSASELEECLYILESAHRNMNTSPAVTVYQRYIRSASNGVASLPTKPIPDRVTLSEYP